MSTTIIESEHFDPKIHLVVADLHSHGEFGSNIMIVRASIAANGHRKHITDVN